MVGSRFALLVGFGLLPASLWAQKVVRKPVTAIAKTPKAAALATHADSVAHYQRPAYPGGDAQMLQDVQRKVRYPAAALRAKVEGRVVVALTIEADGSVSEARILKSPSPLLNDEVLRAAKTLGTFTPAQQYGQPVRSTATLPLSFHITGISKTKLPVRRVPRGPVQPQLAALAGHRVVQKLVSWQDSSYWVDKGQPKVFVYRHYFTYDRLGRPATHIIEYQSDGQLMSSQMLRYEYDRAGRIVAKVSESHKYLFQYGSGGAMSRITGYYYQRDQQWVAYEETRLSEKTRQPDGSRIISQETSYKGESGSMRREMATDYLLTADSLVTQSTTYFRSHQALARPQVAVFAYDTKPNPCEGLLTERCYRYEAGFGGPHNVVSALAYGKPWKTTAYTYNEAGYPTQAITRRSDQTPYQTQTFTYANIMVPAPLAAVETSDVGIYPNPASASTTVSIKATRIGKGAATLRLFDAATGELRQQTEHQVAATFDASLSVAGLAKGVYIVEITSGATAVRSRLLVE